MSDFLIVFFKKIAYLNLNLFISVGFAAVIIWIGKIKNPHVRYIIWSLVILRFIFNAAFYPENSDIRNVSIPYPFHPPLDHPRGMLVIGFNFSSSLAEIFKTLVTSVWLDNIRYTAGDILAVLLKEKTVLYIGFFTFALGAYMFMKRITEYNSFQRELRKTMIPYRHYGEDGIFTSDHLLSPLVIGFIKPVIVLPISFTLLCSKEELRVIIRHERSHILRHDHIIFAVLSAIEALFISVYPLKMAIKRLEETEEQICDRMVVNAGEFSHDVATVLLKLAEFQLEMEKTRNAFSSMNMQSVPGFMGEKKFIENRLRAVFSCDYSNNKGISNILSGILFYTLLFILVFGYSVL